ncbi:MAG: hypothetical protein Q4G43_13320, partial [Mobilicoccus sp.]|nr:hypothetical protein [Mobilicoccus sp.]
MSTVDALQDGAHQSRSVPCTLSAEGAGGSVGVRGASTTATASWGAAGPVAGGVTGAVAGAGVTVAVRGVA